MSLPALAVSSLHRAPDAAPLHDAPESSRAPLAHAESVLNTSRASTSAAKADRAALRIRIKSATTVARAVAARAGLDDAGVQRLRSLNKDARPDRLKSQATLAAVADALERYAEHLALQFPDGDVVLRRARDETRADLDRKTRASRGRPRVMRAAAKLQMPVVTDVGGAMSPLSPDGAAPEGAALVTAKPAKATSARRFPSLDELTDDQRAAVAQLRDLMTRMDGGMTVAQGLAYLHDTAGLTRQPRWLKKLRARWRRHGEAGLYDWRWVREVEPQVSEAVRDLTLAWYLRRRGAGPKVVHELVAESCAERGLATPSYPWVTLFLRSLPAAYRVVREDGMEAYTRAAAPVAEYSPTTYANEQWQIDNCRTDVWIRVRQRDGSWVASELWITAVIDVHSRAIMGYLLSTKTPTAWTTAMTLRHAIMPKASPGWHMRGVPAVLTTDHGKDFTAKSVRSSIRALGIRFDLCDPHYPNMKGEIERWFRTFQEGHLAKHPGYKPGGMKSAEAAAKHVMELLTLDDLNARLLAWITNVYHTRVHEGISIGPLDQSPGTLWERSVRLRTVPQRELDVLVLKSDKIRTITNVGIRFKLPQHGKMAFWHPALADIAMWRAKVRIRYNPHDLRSVIVYRADSNERICEAFPVRRAPGPGVFTISDIKIARRQARRGVAERLQDAEDLRLRDMAASPQAWAQAEAIVDQAVAPRANTASRADGSTVTSGHGARAARVPMRPATPRLATTTPKRPQQDSGVLSIMDLMQRKMRGQA